MRLIMRSGDVNANLRVDAVERVGDVVYAYRNPPSAPGQLVPMEFAGMFDLGSVDFIYTTTERGERDG